MITAFATTCVRFNKIGRPMIIRLARPVSGREDDPETGIPRPIIEHFHLGLPWRMKDRSP